MKNKLCLFIILMGCIIFFSNGLEARLYFMHVPKTGGTTLRLLLELQLSAEEIYPFRNCKSAASPVNEHLVSGHFPYWFCKGLDENFEKAFKVIILRDPIERYLSFLRAKKKADSEMPDLESVLRLRLSSSNKYQEGLIDNALCRYLSEDPQLEGEALLESAISSLEKMDCVIFFDHFSRDVLNLFTRLGIRLEQQDIPKINVTHAEPVNPNLLAEIKSLNELDIRLYEYAKSHLIEKHTTYPLRTCSFENMMKKVSYLDYTFNLPLNGRGWTYREKSGDESAEYPYYRWVMDRPAEACFCLEEGGDYLLSFSAQPLTAEALPQVNVNGKEIEISKTDTGVFSLYQGIIPKECLTEKPVELSFYSSKAFLYWDVYPSSYNRNHPPLSFALNRIQISKM